MEMEKKLIRFAKVHGYLSAALLMSLGIVLIGLKDSPASSRYEQYTPLYLLLWAISPVLITIGTVLEDASWFKTVKHLYICISIAGSLGIIFGQTLDSSFPLSGWFVILAISLYGFYVLRFLKELFTDLERRKLQTVVTITAIVCESLPAAPEKSEPELPGEEQQHHQSVAPPPSYEQTVPLKPDETREPKEFPTWT